MKPYLFYFISVSLLSLTPAKGQVKNFDQLMVQAFGDRNAEEFDKPPPNSVDFQFKFEGAKIPLSIKENSRQFQYLVQFIGHIKFKNAKWLIKAYTDRSGNSETNKRLSVARAENLVEHLRRQFPDANFEVLGVGESETPGPDGVNEPKFRKFDLIWHFPNR